MAEIEKGQADPSYSLKMDREPESSTRTRGPRYTPVSKRSDKPDGIAWIIRNHPEVSDGQIGKLIGTTRNTISAIRDKSHWNMANITPKDPVTLGLCPQRELDAVIEKAAKAAGLAPRVDTRFAGDREALIYQLRNERVEAARLADAIANGEIEAPAMIGSFVDPFKR